MTDKTATRILKVVVWTFIIGFWMNLLCFAMSLTDACFSAGSWKDVMRFYSFTFYNGALWFLLRKAEVSNTKSNTR